jgi:hypothetical protein
MPEEHAAAPPARDHTPDDPLATLRRWEDSGAVWWVLSRTGDRVTVGMFTCDGGEEVSRFATADPRLLQFVDERGNGQG